MNYKIRREEITQVTVVNDSDSDENQRVLGITVDSAWWAAASSISKQMMYRGLTASAIEKWSAEDTAKAQAKEHARIEAEAAAAAEEAEAALGTTPEEVLDEEEPMPTEGPSQYDIDVPAWNATAREHPTASLPEVPRG